MRGSLMVYWMIRSLRYDRRSVYNLHNLSLKIIHNIICSNKISGVCVTFRLLLIHYTN